VLLVVLDAVPSASAQNVAGATEVTQTMNFMQLLQLATTAESQLRSMQMMVQITQQSAQRLSRGDVLALRDAFSAAMMVQYTAFGFLSAQRSAAAALQATYPSPEQLDGRFKTWPDYYQYLDNLEQQNHRTLVEASQVIDKQLTDGVREDARLLQQLRDKAGAADTPQKQQQVTNLYLAELVRQMQMLRVELLNFQRMQLLVTAAESGRRSAQTAASRDLLPQMRVGDRSQYDTYSASGKLVRPGTGEGVGP
jgi:hypothetical protein